MKNTEVREQVGSREYSPLVILAAADFAQATIVFENTLGFDLLFAKYLAQAPAEKNRAADQVASLEDLLEQVRELREDSIRFLEDSPELDIVRMADQRHELGRRFFGLAEEAGVVHDSVPSVIWLAPVEVFVPDRMNWSVASVLFSVRLVWALPS